MKRDDAVRLTYAGREQVASWPAPAPIRLAREDVLGPPVPAGTPASLLVRADNLGGLAALRPALAGRVDLVYLDPPFATAEDFGAFDDRWPDRAAYLGMLEKRLRLLRALLSERGSLIVHLDWHVGHLVRALLGEIFGEENSLGEIIWAYGSPSGGRTAGAKLVKAHDILYWFARRRGRHIFHPLRVPYHERYLRDWFRYVDDDGRRYRKRWRGRGRVERQYLDQSPGMPLSTVWSDIQQVYADPRAYKAGTRSDVTGYPTQKPLKLLERLIALATDPGGLVVDAFCGSGTTLVAAARLRRSFVGIDVSAHAVHVSKRRLLVESTSFEVWADAPPPAGPPLRCRAHARGLCVEVQLDPSAAAQADLWEVGFEPQVVRRALRERGRLTATLAHEYTRPGRHRVRVRVLGRAGEASTQELLVTLRNQ
ncbi:MAG TPA: site-specific DNA-methyltransferase [Polyangia bacterium]|nr:site-specific DNA-methyltransferase [Polyangia bacterium]